jgi:hypothetical protein
LLSLWAIVRSKLKGQREILYLTIPPAFYLFVAMAAGMNIGVGHILPIWKTNVMLGDIYLAMERQDEAHTYYQ